VHQEVEVEADPAGRPVEDQGDAGPNAGRIAQIRLELGKLALRGVNTIDLPTTEGVVVFATTAILLITLIVDCLYAWLDPRIRLT